VSVAGWEWVENRGDDTLTAKLGAAALVTNAFGSRDRMTAGMDLGIGGPLRHAETRIAGVPCPLETTFSKVIASARVP